jgi:hypothetical protein
MISRGTSFSFAAGFRHQFLSARELELKHQPYTGNLFELLSSCLVIKLWYFDFWVNNPLLYFVIDLLGDFGEHFVNIKIGFCWRFKEFDVILFCECLGFFCWHFPPEIILLNWVTSLPNRSCCRQAGKIIACCRAILLLRANSVYSSRSLALYYSIEIWLGNIVDDDGGWCWPVVWSGDRTEWFLSRLIDALVIDVTVSQMESLMFLLSSEMILAPNSTPMVTSCLFLNRLSMNCRRRHVFPTAKEVCLRVIYLSRQW